MAKSYPGDYTAADLMTRRVVTVTMSDSLRDVMALLVEHRVSGAPVVNADGECVGVVSATDILGYEQDHSDEVEESNEEVAQIFDDESQRWESIRLSAFALERIAAVPVSEVMSRSPITVEPATPAAEVARRMVEHHVHRVLVVDAKRRIKGIVSAFDFVRTVAGPKKPKKK
jgi:CBS domain-containing protein